MCRAVMYGGMEETYGIRVLYSGLESRRYMGLSSCQFLLFSPTVSAYEDLHVSTSTGKQAPCVRMTNKVRGVSRLNDTEKNSMDRRKDDVHESRNVVKFFFEQWYQPVATTGAIGPPGPSTCVGCPQACACPASGCDCSSPRALRGPCCIEWVVFFTQSA